VAEISNRAVGAGALCAVLGVALAFATRSDAAAPRYDDAVRCAGKVVRGVELETRSPEGAVFSKPKRYGASTLPTTYACLVRSGPIVRLDSPPSARAGLAALSGRYVAYKRTFEASEFNEASDVVVTDLKAGAYLRMLAADPGGGYADVQRLVVKRNGALAWTAVGVRGPEVTVFKSDPAAPAGQELDRGPSVDAQSLRLAADRRSVSWTHGGSTRSAPLG
jgi:hypothetical protein